MRVLAPFLTAVASVFTIVATMVRLRWDKLNKRVYESAHTGREAMPRWVKTAATIWLVVVIGGGTVLLLFVFIKIVIDLSN